MDDQVFYGRVRAILCDSWGIPPWEFDKAAEEQRIEAGAVVEALLLRYALPFVGESLDAFLHREARAKQKAVVAEMQFLALKLKAVTDPERRQAITKRLEELQQWQRRQS